MKRHDTLAFRPDPPNRRSFVLGLLCCLSLLFLLPGCSTSGSSTGSGPLTGMVLRNPMSTDPTTFDPATLQDGTTIDLMQQVYEGLVRWDDKNQIVPNIAEKWEVSQDGKTYTFHLKHGVKFHHGREVKAADFKYSIERACDPTLNSPNIGYLRDIVGVNARWNDKTAGIKEIPGLKVVDPYTLEITIDAFKPYWLGNMTYPNTYVVCREVLETSGGKISDGNVVGTGPFMLEPGDYKISDQVKLTANPEYRDGKPKLDYVVREIIKDGSTRLSKYEAGELDMVQISPSDLEKVNNNPKLKADLKAFPRARIWYVGMNLGLPNSPFANPKVRQAFAMAIDKKEVIKVGLHDEADLANGILPPGVLGYNPQVKPIPFDPIKARELLAQAGYPGGKGFPPQPYTYRNDDPAVAEVADVIRQQIKTNLGIELQAHPMQWPEFLNERQNKRIQLGSISWGADYLDPQNFLTTLLHTDKNGDHQENGLYYSNPEFDALCDQADVEHDPKKRIELYQKAEQIAVNDAPWVPLYFQKDLLLIKPNVANYSNSLFGILPYTQLTVTK
jgi:oligopeptide transport system substrate-binding protein